MEKLKLQTIVGRSLNVVLLQNEAVLRGIFQSLAVRYTKFVIYLHVAWASLVAEKAHRM